MNDRPEEFPRAMASLLAQEGADLRVVIVGNGCEPDYVPDGVTPLALPENLGIPEGRNVGADALAGPEAGEIITATAARRRTGRQAASCQSVAALKPTPAT